MKSVERSLALVTAMLSVSIGSLPHSAATENNTPVAYFSEEALNNLPPDGKDVVVAKVRLQIPPPIWMGDRPCEGCTNDIWFTRLKITEVLRGKAEAGQMLDVLLGQRSEHRRYIALPCTPHQRRLASFPISKSRCDGLSAECLAYERERSS